MKWMEICSEFKIGRLNIVKMLLALPKLIYRFKTISDRNPATLFIGIEVYSYIYMKRYRPQFS